MKILFSSLKGGVGKSANCIQLANFLTKQAYSVNVIDAGEGFLSRSRAKDLETKSSKLDDNWNLERIPLSHRRKLKRKLKQSNHLYTLIDTTNDINSRECIHLYNSVDYIIIPFDYSPLCLASTQQHYTYLSGLNLTPKVILLPNKISSNKTDDSVVDEHLLKELYYLDAIVCPPILDNFIFSKCNTLYLADEVFNSVSQTYNFLLDRFTKN